jgi:phosphoinositide-3-kinase regulatory subunit 4
MMSHDSSASDAEQVTELRRRLVALDSLRMSQHDINSSATPIESEAPATPRPGDLRRSESVTSVPSTTNVQDPSISGKTARSKGSGSIGTESAKAAPAIGASPAMATGQLEIAAHMRLVGLDPRISQPGSPKTEGRQDSVANEVADGKPYTTTYEGRDPAIISLLETAWQETGAAIDDAFHAVLSPSTGNKRRTPRSSTSRLARDASREVTLIAHLPEHSHAVAGIIVSPEMSYYSVIDVMGGISTWETSRLERSVSSKPRLRLQLADVGRVTAVCAVNSTHCFAVACSTGAVEIVRITVSTAGSSVKLLKMASHRRHQLLAAYGYVVSMAYVLPRESIKKSLKRSVHSLFSL